MPTDNPTFENEGDYIIWKKPAKRAAPPSQPEEHYDWEAFQREVLRLTQGGQGAVDAETLQDHMRHWCLLTWRRCPTEALLRDKLQPVCQRQGQGEAAPV